jgi:hypothetical protein
MMGAQGALDTNLHVGGEKNTDRVPMGSYSASIHVFRTQ